MLSDDEADFWAHATASLGEGVCPLCRARLEPDPDGVPGWASGGYCPRCMCTMWARNPIGDGGGVITYMGHPRGS